MRFADVGVGPVHPHFEGEGVIHLPRWLAGVEQPVVGHCVVGEELAAPEEPDGVPLRYGDGRGRESQVGAVDGDHDHILLRGRILRYGSRGEGCEEEGHDQ